MVDKRSSKLDERTRSLYQVSLGLPKQARNELHLRFPVEIYVQDPLVAKKYKDENILGISTIDIDWEPNLRDGPTSARIAVLDYDADKDLLTDPVQWDEAGRYFRGVDNPDSFQFHQVNVWAIALNTLSFFEDRRVMGRPIPWGFDGNRLTAIPHAGEMKNAFYDRNSKTLKFFYFNVGNETVYTCLSHDIVAHETGHAILDGIRPHYNIISSIQTSAFHEFLADLTTILSALRNNDVRRVVADTSKADLMQDKVIANLAEEFAKDEVASIYGDIDRYYLRTAHNSYSMEDMEGKWEAHFYSQIMTGAMFEILARMTKLHLKKRNYRGALWEATRRFNRIALRALDYCPPVDVQFIEYGRAMLRADEWVYPVDKFGYRTIIKEVFEKRGLTGLETETPPLSIEFLWKHDFESISRSRTAAYYFLNDNRDRLGIPHEQDIKVADIYYTRKVVDANQKLPQEIVLQYIWEEKFKLEGSEFELLDGQETELLCGGTLVFDGLGNVVHWCKKPGTENGSEVDRLKGEERKSNFVEYIKKLVAFGMVDLTGSDEPEDKHLQQPAVLGRVQDGTLRLEATPHLVHPARA
jgi:hypothetical protein